MIVNSKLFQWQTNTPILKVYINPIPPPQVTCNTRYIFKQSKAGLNSEFSFFQTSCLPKSNEISLLNYLPIAGERGEKKRKRRWRRNGFMPLSGELAQNEIQTDLSWIWTWVTWFPPILKVKLSVSLLFMFLLWYFKIHS